MKKILQYATLGLGLSLGSCVSTPTASEYKPTPVVLYEHLIRNGQETADKGRAGEAEMMYGGFQLKATATASPLGRGQLDLLLYDSKTQWGILFRDGVKGPLDGIVDEAVIRTPLGPTPFYVANTQAAAEGYLIGSAQLVARYIAEPSVDASKKPRELIDDFLKLPGKTTPGSK